MRLPTWRGARAVVIGGGLALPILLAAGAVLSMGPSRGPVPPARRSEPPGAADPAATAAGADVPGTRAPRKLSYRVRFPIDTSGTAQFAKHLRWTSEATLEEIAENRRTLVPRMIEELDKALPPPGKSDSHRLVILISKVNVLNMQGDFKGAYELLARTRAWVEQHDALAELGLSTVIFMQGVTALRRGETENCIDCRGESSCILPISPVAVHTNPAGSRLAIQHFAEFLELFPDDLEARWLLNIAHMTLAEHPDKVDPRYLIRLDHYRNSEFDIGRFRDIGHLVNVDRLGQSGGGVLEDLDNDGRLDLTITNYDPQVPMTYFRNAGDGTFEDRTRQAGLLGQLGGQTAIPTDYNNDGRLDLFIARGAWYMLPIRQSLLRNDGDGRFTDVTEEAGLIGPLNCHISRWADFDNDGWIDVFLICEQQSICLYRNRGDGTFVDVTDAAGLYQDPSVYCKGADWIDYDNDDYPDLFVDNMVGDARFFRNNHDGTFTDIARSIGIDGPRKGFSCWTWDYDNDGWLDIFATCYDLSLGDVVKGLIGQPHSRLSNRLFHNVGGKRFEDRTKEAGLDMVFATMGSNFGDFDNDGFLDFYLGTGATSLEILVPNRMFKNVGGRRFADISASSGTGHLQKGHSVSCGDWDRDGDVDIFIQMGGSVPGDSYHNVLFQNPGQGNHWLTVKLVGKKTNRAAIGARIKVVTAGAEPLTIHRHVSTGSSWGANPLEQHIGLARADRVARLEIYWPTSRTTQVFRDIPADRAIEVTEFASEYRKLDWKPIRLAE